MKQTPDKLEGPEAWAAFDNLVTSVLNVPHAEIAGLSNHFGVVAGVFPNSLIGNHSFMKGSPAAGSILL